MVVVKGKHDFCLWDLAQLWATKGALDDLDRNKTFRLDDPSFNTANDLDIWCRNKPRGHFDTRTIIHRLPYKTSEDKLEADDVEEEDKGLSREMELGGIQQALEEYSGCNISGSVTPTIGSVNLISETIDVITKFHDKWDDDGVKATECLKLGTVAQDIVFYIKEKRSN